MKRILLCVLVGVLVASVFVGVVNYAAGEGSQFGDFPTRTFLVVRSSPGGPRTDRFTVDIPLDRNGYWSVVADTIAGSSVIVEVWQLNAGISTLEGSTKLRFVGQESTPVWLIKGLVYTATFTPYGKAGNSIFKEHFDAPYAPVAAFSYEPVAPAALQDITFNASASSDLNNNIATYAWDFGDGSSGSGVIAAHAYATSGTYNVVLTVTDTTGLFDTATMAVAVAPPINLPPVAAFSLTRDLMTVTVNGAGSSDPDGVIADFTWDWGDGNVASSGADPSASHTYANPGMYTITLLVTDDEGATASVAHDVTVNTNTEDWAFYDFFNVPYGEWWDIRGMYGLTGDVPIGADCFSQDGVNNFWCVPGSALPDVASYPYANWAKTPAGDAIVVAPYRFTADIRQNPAITMDQPLMLPRCEDLQAAAAAQGVTIECPAVPPSGGSFSIDEHIGYLTTARAIELGNAGCPDMTFLNDGYITELQATITMDAAAAAKLFGVTDPAAWAFGTSPTSLLKAGCGSGLLVDPSSGVLEQGLKAWFEAQGNGPFDVLSVNNAPFSVFSVEASATYDAVTGKATLVVDMTAWGFEALFARWAYWGAATYVAGLAGAAPSGWWGMEMPWTEDLSFSANVGATSFDAQAGGVIQYHFRASGNAGPDAIWYTSDDVPLWVWQPVLGDRFAATPSHTASELTDYAGLTYLHTTPGSHRYATAYAYDYVPTVWAAKPGETQTFQFPAGAVVLYNPFLSGRLDDPRSLAAVSGMIVLGSTVPAGGAGAYDAATNTLFVLGPVAVGSVPTTATGKPLESRPIYRLVQG